MLLNITPKDIENAKVEGSNPVETALRATLSKLDAYITIRVTQKQIVIGACVYTKVSEVVKQIVGKFSSGVNVKPCTIRIDLT